MDEYKKHIDILGLEIKDKVTGFKGVAESVSFDLYGCIQVLIKPSELKKEGEIADGYWFDISRVEIVKYIRVVDMPDFNRGYVAQGKKGPANKMANKA